MSKESCLFAHASTENLKIFKLNKFGNYMFYTNVVFLLKSCLSVQDFFLFVIIEIHSNKVEMSAE